MACLEFSPARSSELAIALQSLVDGDFELRWDAAKQLVRLGPATLSPLLELLQAVAGDPEDDLHWFIARILGELRHPLAVAALGELIQTDRKSVV